LAIVLSVLLQFTSSDYPLVSSNSSHCSALFLSTFYLSILGGKCVFLLFVICFRFGLEGVQNMLSHLYFKVPTTVIFHVVLEEFEDTKG
jgi:hypothetical protein